jgi:GNAT superfamily N-acetyltransferase
MQDIKLIDDPPLESAAIGDLTDEEGSSDWTPVLNQSLAYVGAYHQEQLVGFVNVAWDGGVHAFLLDPRVHPEFRRRGIGTALVRRATELARDRGAEWLHVDYEPHLHDFYARCGFRSTLAGLIQLA